MLFTATATRDTFPSSLSMEKRTRFKRFLLRL
jgi:hypothetical protein